MEPKLGLNAAEGAAVGKLPYANLLMELMRLARCTQPDILTACCYLARFVHFHDQTRWKALLHKTVALSLAEELMALTGTARDAEHACNLRSEFAVVQQPMTIHQLPMLFATL
ncbi:hypothetical protein CYMTET_48840 [Cymbomonas tetramitiformis]|uniref:Uncharacterized protein n=1 Tax=Cymbomonas tetramitiformis TaxID=36881 RepID=A0AAE0BT39_9CHLO|nr:hypothetical protein CYMTET_48840 [Cymbomonas tetramitiformis]